LYESGGLNKLQLQTRLSSPLVPIQRGGLIAPGSIEEKLADEISVPLQGHAPRMLFSNRVWIEHNSSVYPGNDDDFIV
jgi:hypothetical protein